ncbi:zinc-binding dehydrogenase [Hyalangium rubrum]|uniref:Zinc-binding dehydrogenase n=1 Tax=Hyalangium rubrum TaxID=3103134 RepID=A0ABU5GVR8_9BACT|nr:zinc-binding dehydrogenase [Hyalangium sp. s54d21]MDY7225288.1 zinc-binding dehydrogenase [Hyalangium sp. s54d21]
MKAVVFHQHGDEQVLQHTDVAEPSVGSRDVLVRVKAVALNHLDIFTRQGWPGLKLELPHILGSDIAGVVERVGPEVGDLAPGAEVLVNPGLSCGACERCLTGEDNLCRQYRIIGEHVRGGYAEFVSVPRQNILPKPARITFAEAACLPRTYLTAWTMLVRRAQVRPGETVLVHAAGSGVGSAAVQICKLLGAKVIATASTEAKLQRARQLGADHTINYVEKDFLDEVKRITQRRLVDVVFEHVGAATFEKSVACLPYGGRLVTCGATTGYEAKLDLRVLFYKRISLLGSTMGSKGDLFRVLQLVEEGKLKPVLDRTLPLADAAQAHRLMKDRAQFGNLVLIP